MSLVLSVWPSPRLPALRPFFLVLLLSAQLCACSAVGSLRKGVLDASIGSWQLQPEALRNGYPEWIQNVYFNAETLSSDAGDWRYRLTTLQPVDGALAGAGIAIRYKHAGQWQQEEFPLMLVLREALEMAPTQPRYRYTFAPGVALQTRWREHQQDWFSYRGARWEMSLAPRLRPQPEPHLVTKLEFSFAKSFGFRPLAETARRLIGMGGEQLFSEAMFDQLCADPAFPYPREQLCGQVLIRTEEDPVANQ